MVIVYSSRSYVFYIFKFCLVIWEHSSVTVNMEIWIIYTCLQKFTMKYLCARPLFQRNFKKWWLASVILKQMMHIIGIIVLFVNWTYALHLWRWNEKKTKTEHQNVPSVTCSSQIADWSWRDATLKSINTTTFLSKIECLKVIFLLKLLNRLHLQNDDATLNIEFIRTLLSNIAILKIKICSTCFTVIQNRRTRISL